MVKNHLKRLNAPKKWGIKRKGITFVTRPMPGPHKMDGGVPLNVLIRDLLKIASTTREVKNILENKNVLINGIRRKDVRFIVGLFDAIELQETKEYFRLVLTKKGKIAIIPTDKNDAEIRICKITGKTKVKGKTQLNLFDGSNMLIEKDDYKVGDTIVLSTGKKDIKKKVTFDKKSLIYLIEGKHVGTVGIIEDIKGNKITYKLHDGVFETLKEYAFVVGDGDKPLIKIMEK